MAVLLLLTRASLRRRRGALVGLALALALGLGVAVASLEASVRTDRAYPAYLARSEVAELVVNPSLSTDRAEEIIASTPGVKRYVSDSLLTATADRGEPRAQSEIDLGATQVRLSTDGRYVTQDRPVVTEGRMVNGGAEAFVNVEMAEALGIHVGDTLPLAFWPNAYPRADGPEEGALLEPFGRTEARVVGIGVFSDEVLADGLYPRHRAVITPDVGARFDCSFHRPPEDDRPLGELIAAIVPPGCSMSYRYYSLRIEGGDRGVGPVTDALSARFDEENEHLPAELRANDVGYQVIPTVTAEERQRVQRSLDPAVRALQLFAVAAIVATLVVALLAAVRIARRQEEHARNWRELGVVRGQRTAAIAVPLAAAAALGLAASLVVGWLASGLGPVASAGAVVPDGRLGLSGVVVLAVLGGSAATLAVGLVLVARAAAKGDGRTESRGASRAQRSLAPAGSPPLTLGVRAAVAGAGARALLGASVAAVTAVLSTSVFSASLDALVSRPERFGWPYDVAATVNYGYGGSTDPAAIAATLERPEVAHWGLAISYLPLTIDGRTVPSLAARAGFDALRLPVVEGSLPVAGDEIAVGTKTARTLGLHVGQRVLVKSFYGVREATVRGLVVLPPIGAFGSDRASLGNGMLVSAPFIQAILGQAETGAGAPPGALSDGLVGFVGVDLRPGVDPDRFLTTIREQTRTWDGTGALPFVYPRPVRPPTIANVAAMRALPTALAGMLAAAMAAGLFIALAVAVRGRRRELAVLRALGCVGRQLRASVRWQALAVVGVGLVAGIPLGLAAGRITYRGFATGLGVRPEPLVSLAWMLLLVVATLAIALLAAFGPGRRASRVAAAEVLRNE